ncbi:MAG: hypothetical protein D4R67_06320 [Bacteroidetes bacterium]|nr:MAG: hypothetical protein D4R67_06320 [Bacteroidota bacterium]
MMKKIVLCTVLTAFAGYAVYSQVSISDSSITTPMIYATFSYQFPGGDLAARYGSNSSIGGGFLVKTKSNWIFGVEGNFQFGSTVKNQDSLLKPISTPEGYIIDANGKVADVILYERGYSFFGLAGKLFPWAGPNPNCGFTLIAGGGYLQNKMRILNPDNTAPQLQGDYKKGYDRLNGGFALSASVGYLYMSSSRLLNFSLAFEFIQAWTKSKRELDFNTGKPDQAKLSTQFYGIKATWDIPLYRRTPKEYYLY